MNTDELTQLNAETPAQHRAFIKAARRLGLRIGHLTPAEALRKIIADGHGPLVANTARHLFPEVFNLETT